MLLQALARLVRARHGRQQTPELVLRVFATENDRLLFIGEVVNEHDRQSLYRIERAIQEELNPHAVVVLHWHS
jgi:hypothetical protein